MSQKNKLDFSDFFSKSPQDWKENILKELKADSDQILSKNASGIEIKGFYTSEDTQKLNYLRDFHNHYLLKSPRHWYTAEYLPFKDPKETNNNALKALKGGADGLYIVFENPCISTKDFVTLLDKFELSFPWLQMATNGPVNILAESIKNVDNYHIKGMLTKENIVYKSGEIEVVIDEYSEAFIHLRDTINFKSLGISSSISNTPTIEISNSVCLALEIVNKITSMGYSAKDVLSEIGFSVSMGKNFFNEIAKLRALRLIWQIIAKEYDPSFDAFSTPIHCKTSISSFSEDANKNILVNTTQAMSGILGGCDSLTITPSDSDLKPSNEFSSRIARNVSILLKEEARFNYVADPLGGSYMIDSLTHQIAEGVLERIKTIEGKKGLLQYLKEGNTL